MRQIDATTRRADECNHFSHDIHVAEFVFGGFQGIGQAKVASVNDGISPSDSIDPRSGNSRTPHPDHIDSANMVDVLLDDERWNVLGRGRHAAEQNQAPDAAVLVYGAVPGKKNAVFQQAMAAQKGTIGQDTLVANDAIMGNMAAGHEEIVVTNPGFKPFIGASMDRHIFAEDIVLPNDGACFFAAEFQVLRKFAQYGAAVNHVRFAHLERAYEHRMRTDHTSRTQADATIKDGVRPNLAIFTHMGLSGYHRCWVDSC